MVTNCTTTTDLIFPSFFLHSYTDMEEEFVLLMLSAFQHNIEKFKIKKQKLHIDENWSSLKRMKNILVFFAHKGTLVVEW